MSTQLIAGLTAGLLFGCAGSSPQQTPATPNEFALRDALTAIRAAPQQCKDTCCFEKRLGALESQSVSGSREALRKSAVSQAQRAAVIVRRAALRDPRDLDWIERALSQDVIVWDAPHIAAAQAAVICQKASSWAPVSVSQVALQALGRIIGRRFGSVREWHAWRAAHPHAERSAGFWQSRLPYPQTAKACESISTKIRALDVDLLIRLSVALHHRFRGQGPAQCVGPTQLRQHADRVFAALMNPKTWRADPDPAYAKDTGWSLLSIWAFSNAEELFTARDRERLFGLAQRAYVASDPKVFSAIAAALVRIDPQRGAPILERAIEQSPADLLLVSHYARLYPVDAKVKAWLTQADKSPCAGATVAAAAVKGLARAVDAPAGRARLVDLVKKSGRELAHRPHVLRVLAFAAISDGASPEDFECRNALRNPSCMKMTRKSRRGRLEEFERAKSQCWTAIRRHYAR